MVLLPFFISLTMATDVHASLKIMMQSSMTKPLSCSLIKLKANMQSTRARDRKTRLRRIVIDRILTSRPSIWAAMDDFKLMECVTVVSSWLPYLRIDTPKTRKEMPVKARTHLSNYSFLPAVMLALCLEKQTM